MDLVVHAGSAGEAEAVEGASRRRRQRNSSRQPSPSAAASFRAPERRSEPSPRGRGDAWLSPRRRGIAVSPQDIVAFAQASAGGPRLIGIDLGTKTIGLALSDLGRQIASPLETIRRVKFTPDVARLTHLCTEHGVGGLVIGLPLNLDGSEGPRVQSTRSFVRNLAPILPLPVIFHDERLSTAAVERMLIGADASRARRGELVDKLAAAYILQGFLDRMRSLDAAPTDW